MERKKIIFLGPAHPFRGGIASSSEILALKLHEQGHEVQMMTFTTQYPKIIFPGKSQFTDSEAPEHLKITRAYSSINPFSWLRLRSKIKASKADMIISRFWLPYLGLSAGFLLKPYKTLPDLVSLSIVDNLIPHQKMIGDKLLTKYYMGSHDKFVVMSKSVGTDIEQNFPGKKVLHVPHPIYDNYGPSLEKEEACRKLNLDVDYKYILFFGFIKPYKGLHLLLEALDTEYMEGQKIKLLIAGEVYGDEKPYLDKIQKLALDNYVVFHNRFIHDHMVNAYFGASDLIAQTYLSATQSGISQIALNYEKPVLVTDVGGLSEMVHHMKTGYVVEKNPDDVMAGIKDFFDHNRAAAFADDIKALKAENSWAEFAKKLMSFAFMES